MDMEYEDPLLFSENDTDIFFDEEEVDEWRSTTLLKLMFYTIFLVASCACIIGLTGNGLLIYILARYSKVMKSLPNFILLNLALVDLSFLSMLPILLSTMALRRWAFGSFLCTVFNGLTELKPFVSALYLLYMSFDNLSINCCRFKKFWMRAMLIGILLSISLVSIAPFASQAEIIQLHKIQRCVAHIFHEKPFFIYLFALYMTPIILIVINLIMIVGKSRSDRGNTSWESSEKVLFALLMCQLLGWTPYNFLQIGIHFANHIDHSVFAVFYTLSICSTAINSALNPAFVFLLHVEVKRNTANLFGLRSLRSRNSASNADHVPLGMPNVNLDQSEL